MSEETNQEQNTIQDLTDKGRETLRDAQDRATDGLAVATEYIRANPWIAVAGAAVIGGVIAVLSKSSRPQPSNLDAVREWLDDAYAKLPSQKQFQSMAKSAGVPTTLEQLKKKLNLA